MSSPSPAPTPPSAGPPRRNPALRSLLWSSGGAVVQTLLRLAVYALLARLIRPADFGVFAAALIVVEGVEFFAVLSLNRALVQRAELRDAHLRSALLHAGAMAALLGVAVRALAPALEGLLRVEGTAAALTVLAWVPLLTGVAMVPRALLQRELRFHVLVRVDLASLLVYAAVAVPLAWRGQGVAALAWGHLAQFAFRLVALLAVQPRALRGRFEVGALGELLRFGAVVSIDSFFVYLVRQGGSFVVGRWLGAAALGVYDRAYGLIDRLVMTLLPAWSKVLFSTAARAQNRADQLRRMLVLGLELNTVLLGPLSVVLFVFAAELTRVLLGPGWQAAVMPFRLLGLGLVFFNGASLSSTLAVAAGAARPVAWRSGVHALVVAAGAWLGQHRGVDGVAAGMSLAMLLNALLMTQLCVALFGLGGAELWRALQPALRLTALIATCSGGLWLGARGLQLTALATLLVVGVALSIVGVLALLVRPGWFLGAPARLALRQLLEHLGLGGGRLSRRLEH